ncbi:UNVERIFIED_CONTAM: hypothetical protein RMT77_019540 [Armadillidium vulgare]
MPGFNLFKLRNPAVKRLIGWRECEDDDKWASKAIESLYKKIKGKRSSLEDLQYALGNPGSPSNCVTIPKSVDGRLQVSNKKSFPHVIYCKVWRWPDLQSHHEIKPVESCKHPFSKNDSEVCINPYHYVRIQRPSLPPVYVPNFSEQIQMSAAQSCLPNQNLPQNNFQDFNKENYCNDLSMGNIVPAYDYPSPQYSTDSFPRNSPILPQKYGITPPNTPPPKYYFNDENNTTNKDFIQVKYEDTPHWASISYYELNQRVGDIFKVKSSNIQVDGFTTPLTTDRFSLGLLSNINRNSTIENTRRHIGRGLCMWYIGGEIYLECLSECAVFVNSHCLNVMSNMYESSVVKLTKGSSLKVFNEGVFAHLLSEGINRGYEYVYGLTKYCFIRISFVKGWGSNYHRYDITSTPCWIEVQILGALRWLDNVLLQMGSSSRPVSSVS